MVLALGGQPFNRTVSLTDHPNNDPSETKTKPPNPETNKLFNPAAAQHLTPEVKENNNKLLNLKPLNT